MTTRDDLTPDMTQPRLAAEACPCFTPGTLIATARGQKPIETLQAGDRVITRDNGLQDVLWVGRRGLDREALRRNADLKPVLIRAGALGAGLPQRDMIVSPCHKMLMTTRQVAGATSEAEVLVAARDMVDHRNIIALDVIRVTYLHLMFARHEVIMADGSWSESLQPDAAFLDAASEAQRGAMMAVRPDLSKADGTAAPARKTMANPFGNSSSFLA